MSLTTPNLEGRPVFAEYHAQGMVTGGFMLVSGRYKLCAYAGRRPQLFLLTDPHESYDLAASPPFADVRDRLTAQLAGIVDVDEVDEVDRRARAGQDRRRGGPAETGPPSS